MHRRLGLILGIAPAAAGTVRAEPVIEPSIEPGEPGDFAQWWRRFSSGAVFSCHGAQEAKGGLSLISATSALAGGESGAVPCPGKPDESLLVGYISGEKPETPKGRRSCWSGGCRGDSRLGRGRAPWPADGTLTPR